MALHMTAQEARDGFSETLNRVGSVRVLVERWGKPAAAIISTEGLEVWKHRREARSPGVVESGMREDRGAEHEAPPIARGPSDEHYP